MSSGSTVTIACTTACSTRARAAAGGSSGSRRRLLSASRNRRDRLCGRSRLRSWGSCGSAVVVVVTPHGVPALPGDAQDDQGDRQADERVSDGSADGDDDRGGYDGERHIRVRGRVVAVGDERGAVEPMPGALTNSRGQEIAHITDETSGRKRPQVRWR